MTVPTRRRPSRRQAAALVAATGAAVAIGLVVTGSGGAGAASTAGPVATAQARDLRVTDAERGTLARADTTTVLYDGTGGRVGGGPAGSTVTARAAGVATPASIAATTCPPPSSTTTSSTSSSTSTSSTSTSSSSTSSSSTTSTTACPPTTSTTAPPTTSTTVPPPSTTTPPTTSPPSTAPPVLVPSTDDRSGGSDDPATGPVGGGLDPGGLDGGSGSATATLTDLLAVGETATRGSVLYRADDEPIVALLSATPLFRDLRTGIADGPDVQAVEAELQALGYRGFTVDEHFDAATATAVRRWEEDLGREDPDGVVMVGEVQLLDEPTAVLEHRAQVGDLLEPGDAVLVLGAESRVIEADVEAAEVGAWAVGTVLEVGWADGTTSTGSVVEVGRDVVDSQVEIVVALAEGAGADAPIGSRVDLVRTVAERSGVVAVPVSAVVQGDGGPAVRLVGSRRDRRVDVELGIVDDGWVEVTSGLEVGAAVRLPA